MSKALLVICLVLNIDANLLGMGLPEANNRSNNTFENKICNYCCTAINDWEDPVTHIALCKQDPSLKSWVAAWKEFVDRRKIDDKKT